MNLPFDKHTGLAIREHVVQYLPEMPEQVMRQFLLDHGRNNEFQGQYGQIDLNAVVWVKESLQGNDLLACSHFEQFDRRVQSSRSKISLFPKEGWKCIDRRSTVVEHWERFHTWNLPPILIEGSLVGRSSALHLIEGHTRLGVLEGLIDAGVIDRVHCHEVWVGRQ